MKKDTARIATELMPSVRLCGQLPAAVAKGGLARPPFAQLGSPRRPAPETEERCSGTAVHFEDGSDEG